MAENQHADVWQKDVPAGVAFEIELREPAPKTVPMKKGGAFDKWKAGIPTSNPLHKGGDHAIEFVWFMVVSTHLKDALRAHGQGRVTITKTLEGEKESFEVVDGWTSAGAGDPAHPRGSAGGGNGRVGRPLPEGEKAIDYLAGLCRATAFAHGFLRDANSIAAALKTLDGNSEARSSYESTILINAYKIAQSASIAGLDSGQDLNAQLRALLRSSPSEVPAGPEPPPEEDDDLPF